jgi:hypothetical protein
MRQRLGARLCRPWWLSSKGLAFPDSARCEDEAYKSIWLGGKEKSILLRNPNKPRSILASEVLNAVASVGRDGMVYIVGLRTPWAAVRGQAGVADFI